MKIKIILFLLFGFVIETAYSQTPPADATTAAKEFFSALTEENSLSLGKLLANDFVLLSFDGQVVDASTLQEGLSGGYIIIDSGDTNRNYTRTYQDTGIVTGIWNVKGSLEGQSFSNLLAYTVVVVRQGGAWKVASVQFTPS